MTSKICSIEDCSAKVKARGYCGKHWTRWYQHGDPNFVSNMARLDLEGVRFGMLTAVADSGNRCRGSIIWRCQCDCGNHTLVSARNLRTGNTRSCGCYQRAKASERNKRHGMSGTPEYVTWMSMKARCKYPSTHAYPWYGGKGVKVCDRWLGDNGFEAFFSDMGNRPGDGWSIDRIDSSGDYEPKNCRWLLVSENSARASRRISALKVSGISDMRTG